MLRDFVGRMFPEIGGVIRYRHDVDEILVEDDRAVGVRTTDGAMHLADRVISCAPG